MVGPHWPDDLHTGFLAAIELVPKPSLRRALMEVASELDYEQQSDRYIALRLTGNIYQRYARPLTPTTDGV